MILIRWQELEVGIALGLGEEQPLAMVATLGDVIWAF